MAKNLKPHQLKLLFSNKYVTAQIINLRNGHVETAASTMEKLFKGQLEKTANKEAAAEIGKVHLQQ